ncbi:DUF4352 domain-containing protein [Micromonospora sp. CA-246542]|uniref:DUF4352 domain-containing protein n=1 Tax=Micromonospora sp. CA-246542 TaxID=3239959 RepID=UPI003D8FED0E
MTHPQPPVGPQDLQQPSPEPLLPATPQRSAADPMVPPATPSPWSTAGSEPVPPPYSGAAYPQGDGPGHPLTMPPPVPPTTTSQRTVVAVAVTTAVLALLFCAGGIVAVVIGAKNAANNVTEALPTPGVTGDTGQPAAGAMPSPVPSVASAKARNMSVGDTLVIDDNGGTVEITVTKFHTATKPCKTYGLKPDEGMFVIADVTVTVTRGTGSANPLFFQWVAADGTETNAVTGAFSGCGKPIPAGNDLAAGSRRTGSVVFDVHDTSGVLEYQHQFATAGSWRP